MATEEELLLKISADITSLTAGLEKASKETERHTKEMAESFEKLNEGFKKSGETVKKLAEFIGIYLTADAFKEFVIGGFEATDQMQKLADKIGVSNEAIYGMKVLAADTGVSFDTLTMSIQRMGLKLEEASREAPELQKGFRDIGLDAKALKEMAPDEAFGKIADALGKVTNQADRTKIAVEIFGRTGIELNNILKEGSKGLEESRKKAEELGITISKVDSEKVVKAVDAMELLIAAVKSSAQHIAVELAPVVEKVAGDLTDMIKNAGGFGEILLDTARKGAIAWDYLEQVVLTLKDAFLLAQNGVSVLFMVMANGWNEAIKAVQFVVNAVTQVGNVFQAVGGFIAAAWNSPMGAIKIVFRTLLIDSEQMLRDFIDRLNAIVMPYSAAVSLTLTKVSSTISDSIKGNIAELNALQLKYPEIAAAALKVGDAMGKITGFKAPGSDMLQGFSDGLKESILSNNKIIRADQDKTLDDSLAKTEAYFAKLKAIYKKGGEDTSLEGDPGDDEDDGTEKKKEDPYLKKMQERMATYTQYYTKAELEEARFYQNQINQAKEAFAKTGASEQEQNLILEGIKKDHEQRVTDIEARAILDRRGQFTQEAQQRLSAFGQMFGNLASLSQSGNKELFAIGQAARYAETIVNTAAAAMASYNVGAGIGGPALGAVFAGAAIAAGAVQLATIKSASAGGGGSVSAPSGGSISGGAAAPAAGVTQSSAPTPQININLGPEDGLLPTSTVRKLIDQIRTAVSDGAQIA